VPKKKKGVYVPGYLRTRKKDPAPFLRGCDLSRPAKEGKRALEGKTSRQLEHPLPERSLPSLEKKEVAEKRSSALRKEGVVWTLQKRKEKGVIETLRGRLTTIRGEKVLYKGDVYAQKKEGKG